MAKKDFTVTSKILLYLLAIGDVASIGYRPPRQWAEQALGIRQSSFYRTAYRLQQMGWIKIVDKDAERFIKLTKKGQLEALLAKARLQEPSKWDGKWRVIIFDIPEETRHHRNFFRGLLKKNGYRKLQKSVFVSPYPLNRAAVEYLKKTKLIEFIRILKVEEMDNDKDLRKLFKLKK